MFETIGEYPTLEPCVFTVDFENSSQIFVVNEATQFINVNLRLTSNRDECEFDSSVDFTIETRQYTASAGLDYKGNVSLILINKFLE
jgi:hypothetical protein